MHIGLSIIIPVYRAQHCLEELHSRIAGVLAQINENAEVIYVEDRGGDESWTIIQRLAVDDSRIRGFKLSRNFGQHAATMCGIAQAKGDWILTMDDDLEQNPEDIPLLLAKGKEGHGLVYGVYGSRTHPLWRNLSSTIARRLFAIAIPELNYDYTSFRLIRSDVAKHLTAFDTAYPSVDGFLSWVIRDYSFVQVQHGTRKYGRSNYNALRLFRHWMNVFVTFSDLPLRILTNLGFITFIIGTLWFATVIIGRIAGYITAPGYASLIGAIILFGGLQMLAFGILGEYIGRVNFKSSRKPQFIIADTTD